MVDLFKCRIGWEGLQSISINMKILGINILASLIAKVFGTRLKKTYSSIKIHNENLIFNYNYFSNAADFNFRSKDRC